MVGDGKGMQSPGSGLGDQCLGLGNSIGRKAGMAVKIDEKLHGLV